VGEVKHRDTRAWEKTGTSMALLALALDGVIGDLHFLCGASHG
jgi:hypothetical protein